jgi:hypothetical protein
MPRKSRRQQQQTKNITYCSTTLLGVIRPPDSLIDYRKQKVPAGVYTLPFGDSARPQATIWERLLMPSSRFCAQHPEDRKAERMEAETLIETSTKINSDHPSVMVLFPGHEDATPDPKLVDKGKGHQAPFAQMRRQHRPRAKRQYYLWVSRSSVSRPAH